MVYKVKFYGIKRDKKNPLQYEKINRSKFGWISDYSVDIAGCFDTAIFKLALKLGIALDDNYHLYDFGDNDWSMSGNII